MTDFYMFYRKVSLDGIISFFLLMTSLIILCGVNDTESKSFKKLLTVLILVISTALYTVLHLVVGMTFGYFLYWYYFIILIAVSEVFAFVFLKGSSFTKTVYILFYVALVVVYKQFCSPLYANEEFLNPTLYACLDIASGLLMYLLFGIFTLVLKRMNFTTSLNSGTMRMGIIFYFPISIIVCLCFGVAFIPKEYFTSILSLIILSNFPVIYRMFSMLISAYEEQRHLDNALTHSRAELSSYKSALIQRDLIRKERHELKNNYFYIQTLLKEKKYDEAEKYINQMIGDFELNLSSIETGNTFLDYLINKKVDYAKHNNINTICQIYVPECIVLDEVSLGTILSNLLDNAIEYSIGREKAELRILIHVAQKYLVCKIENRASKEEMELNPSLKTTKQDADLHGYGLRIVEAAVNKINGIFSTEYQNGYFTAQVMIPLTLD